jgi:hypothetical protein
VSDSAIIIIIIIIIVIFQFCKVFASGRSRQVCQPWSGGGSSTWQGKKGGGGGCYAQFANGIFCQLKLYTPPANEVPWAGAYWLTVMCHFARILNPTELPLFSMLSSWYRQRNLEQIIELDRMFLKLH